MKIKFEIYRSNSSKNTNPRYLNYLVPFNKGMTVLDVITHVYKYLDPTLAYRYECRQGICGTCGVMLNGKPVLSCSTQIDPTLKFQSIGPLANFLVEKDLIVDLKPVLKKYISVKPFIERIKKVRLTKSIADKSKPYRKCIECGCCIAGSATVSKNPEILDPMDLVKIARYFTDPRDGLDRKHLVKKNTLNKYSNEELEKLNSICPRGIPIDKAIGLLKS